MQALNWKSSVTVKTPAGVATLTAGSGKVVHPMVAKLRAAADVWDGRTGNFALGKADTCRDMAAKLERFGSFVSENQRTYAEKLVAWANPAAASAAPKIDPNKFPVPALFDVMQRHATFHVDAFKIRRRNQDSLCWITFEGREGVVGRIADGVAEIYTRNCETRGASVEALRALLLELEANPLVAAMKYGKLSGRCCSCGRDLTDPQSIEAGIGPICATKFN